MTQLSYTTEVYHLRVFDKKGETNFKLSPEKLDAQTCLTVEKTRMIYVVLKLNDQHPIWYIGESSTSIKKRFQRSFISYRHKERTNKALGGYSGYKWITQAKNMDNIKVICFQFQQENLIRSNVEHVEAELVHLTRVHFQDWPLHQNEIHFYHQKSENLRPSEKEKQKNKEALAYHPSELIETAKSIWGEIQAYHNQGLKKLQHSE